MTQLLDDLAKRAQNLSMEERAQLAQALLDSIDHESPPEIRDAWDEELGRRVAAYERGEARLVPAEVVFEEARRLTQ